MRSSSVITALLLCSHSLVCASRTVEVRPGEDVTLLCSNISPSPTQTDWFRVIDRTKPSCVSSLYGAEGEASYCDGFQKERFEMSSNRTDVLLHIKQVEPLDSGLYFCGFYIKKHTVIGSATELIVEDNEDSDEDVNSNPKKHEVPGLQLVILGCLTSCFMVAVVGLTVKIWQIKADQNGALNYDRNKALSSSGPHSAALRFLPKTDQHRMTGDDIAVETHVLYTTSG